MARCQGPPIPADGGRPKMKREKLEKKRKISVFFARNASKVTKNDFGNLSKTQKVFLVDPQILVRPPNIPLIFQQFQFTAKHIFLEFHRTFRKRFTFATLFPFLCLNCWQLPKHRFFLGKPNETLKSPLIMNL